MIIHQEKVRITPSAGDGSDNTLSVMGLCYQVVVKPVTETTQYDIKIIGQNDVLIFHRTSETGTISEFVMMPLRGIYTIQLENSTVDEEFLVTLAIQE